MTRDAANELLVSDLSVSYSGVRAVDGISLRVQPGACAVVLGANGAGKTSTLRAIGGLAPSSRSAEITLSGVRLSTMPAAARARRGLGHCLEGRHVFPGLSVVENLVLGSVATGRRDASGLQFAFSLFPELGDLQEARGGSLSGGQQQFLAIARALMGRPKVLMLDEPTNGLAPLLVERVVEILQRLKSEGIGVLLVEQRLDVAKAVGDEVCLMDRGRIVHSTSSDDPDLEAIAHRVYLGASPSSPAV